MDDHARIVELELDHAFLEALGLGEMLGEFAGKLAVNKELKVVALGDDVDGVPVALLDVGGGQGVLDRRDGRLVVLADDQPVTAEAAMFAPSGCVEIPGTHHVLADTQAADVRMVALEIAFTGFV